MRKEFLLKSIKGCFPTHLCFSAHHLSIWRQSAVYLDSYRNYFAVAFLSTQLAEVTSFSQVDQRVLFLTFVFFSSNECPLDLSTVSSGSGLVQKLLCSGIVVNSGCWDKVFFSWVAALAYGRYINHHCLIVTVFEMVEPYAIFPACGFSRMGTTIFLCLKFLITQRRGMWHRLSLLESSLIPEQHAFPYSLLSCDNDSFDTTAFRQVVWLFLILHSFRRMER